MDILTRLEENIKSVVKVYKILTDMHRKIFATSTKTRIHNKECVKGYNEKSRTITPNIE